MASLEREFLKLNAKREDLGISSNERQVAQNQFEAVAGELISEAFPYRSPDVLMEGVATMTLVQAMDTINQSNGRLSVKENQVPNLVLGALETGMEYSQSKRSGIMDSRDPNGTPGTNAAYPGA